MNSIPAQEIKRRGISALDELLKSGPVHVIRNNKPTYVVLTQNDYVRLSEKPSLWTWLDRPVRKGPSKREIDKQVRVEREAWRASK
jgi:PHD/YefM family antitoxin component YafN of YafNO toxin-antitoxin module